jgi:HAMP domain-containing protein
VKNIAETFILPFLTFRIEGRQEKTNEVNQKAEKHMLIHEIEYKNQQ